MDRKEERKNKMDENIILEEVSVSTISTYIAVGKKSYRQHYLHLWENENPDPYINKSFTVPVLEKELLDSNCVNFLVKTGDTTIGIVKLIIDAGIDEHPSNKSLLAEKIYLLKEFSGKGFGKKTLVAIENYAKGLGKQILWLDTMQKGNPINFYLKTGFTIKKESTLKLPRAKPSEKAMWVLTKAL